MVLLKCFTREILHKKVPRSIKVSGDVIQEIEFHCLPFLRMVSNTDILGESGENRQKGVDVKSPEFSLSDIVKLFREKYTMKMSMSLI